jgi:hypothetical protein
MQPPDLSPLGPKTHVQRRAQPEPVPLDALPCPACQTTLADDADGTRCPACDGLLVHRTWALRAAPELGRPALQPAFVADARERHCPMCRRTMGAVLCHGVLSWSCGRCRWLFFDGPKHRAFTQPRVPAPLPKRTLAMPALVQVVAENARNAAPAHVRDALGVLVLAAIIVIAFLFEIRPT